MVGHDTKVMKLMLLREKRIREARESFYIYCRIINPNFFKPDRVYLKELCDTFQAIYEGILVNDKTGKPYKKLSINLPP
jgi:hypothetical protein